jgi:hypothetical protein
MKRLDVNLATAPFVNRVVPMSILSAVMGMALLLTIFNLASFAILGAEYRSQRKTLKNQEERLQALQEDLNRKQSVLDSPAVASFSEEASLVAKFLAEKRFPWLQFLADFEQVKSFGVMMNSVSPQVDPSGVIHLSVRGVANPRAELMRFEQNLFSDARFREVQLHDEQREAGNPLTAFTLTCAYLPEKTDAP